MNTVKEQKTKKPFLCRMGKHDWSEQHIPFPQKRSCMRKNCKRKEILHRQKWTEVDSFFV